MTHLPGKADEHLHFPDGTHRSTAATANGRDLERFERDYLAHIHAHRALNVVSGTLTEVRYLRTSVNGNPTWRVAIDGRVLRTATDANVGSVLHEDMVGRTVSVSVDGRERVIGLIEL